jgi:predicted ATPase/DNA-binding CsgD family transcriptional regulator
MQVDPQSADAPVEPLNRREKEILTLLAQDQSAAEMAARLHLAVSSVKWNLQELYGKLGVHSRKEALARARSLGWLPGSLAASAPTGPKHNLPSQITKFFGRETEIEHLREQLAQRRLVTLSGPGGVGKTRLALQVCAGVLERYADGIWLAELAPVADPALAAQSVAAAAGAPQVAGHTSQDHLVSHLRERQALLLLDNCEHLLEACARLADALLRACPRLTVLATSREPLGIAGEAVYPVPSLPFPTPVQALAPASLEAYAAINLFADRASLARPGFTLTAHNAAALARICQRLDGMPLAIEMAAARVNLLTPEQLADRLDDAFRVLAAGSRTALPRQQTLRATIDWSYDLLNDAERVLFQRLSVFAGGCTLEAAEAVCAGAGLHEHEILDLIASLAAKSMVEVSHRPEGTTHFVSGASLPSVASQGTSQALEAAVRHRLLEPMRQFAREKLEDDEYARLRRRHRDFFLEVARMPVAFGKNLVYVRNRAWRSKVAADLENIRLALEWSLTKTGGQDRPDAAPLLVLTWVWPDYQETLGLYRRAIAWCQAHPVTPTLHANLLAMASLDLSLNEPRYAVRLASQAVEIARGLDADGQECRRMTLFVLGMRYLYDLDDVAAAQAAFDEAEAIFATLGPEHYPEEEFTWRAARFASFKSFFANRRGQYQAALDHARESQRLFGQLEKDIVGSAEPFIWLGVAYLGLGEHDRARSVFEAQLHAVDDVSESWADQHRAYMLYWLAAVDLKAAQVERAQATAREGLRLAAGGWDDNIVARCLSVLAAAAAAQGEALRAASLAGAASGLYARIGRKAWEDALLDGLQPGWRDVTGPAARAAFEAGQLMTREQAVAVGLTASGGL